MMRPHRDLVSSGLPLLLAFLLYPSATHVVAAGPQQEADKTAETRANEQQQPGHPSREQTHWQVGLSKIDITPQEPVRMAGYGSRNRPSDGVDTPLHVRCMAIQNASKNEPSVLICVDTIGLPGSLTRELAGTLRKRHGLEREHIVFCSTHTHAGPDLISELSNIFATELTDDEIAAGKRYRKQLHRGILDSVDKALADLAPAQLSYDVGESKFAANRRVLTDGRWSGFGVQPDGPVDHTVPVLRITDLNGTVRGVVFNYACHCTTLGGDHYQINADWAGYATTSLESEFANTVALCTIGCGADANPEPRGTLDDAKLHGRVLAQEVKRLIQTPMPAIDRPLQARFDYAALSFELPTQEELENRLNDSRPQTRRHAEQLLATLREHHRLPATYPVPIQSWSFGDQLTMVFLGGEVVVDYATRLKKTLQDPKLWVTAYANDVLGYVASERMRREGGYEYDRSGIYYGLPGPWASGTEDRLVARVKRMLESRGRSRGVSAEEALKTFQLSKGYDITLAAAEPVVRDPINMAFDAEGRMWVVEMGDYPDGENEGRVKTLVDQDGDGVFETATLFLDNLSYPTGVFPWKDGVLVSVAPDILYARDTNGDGRADQVEKLYTGFRLANPQHRVNGFTYGLDHSLHLASGDNLGELTSNVTGETVNSSGHDVQIRPDDGAISVTSGRTQFIRSRNDWGEWFGNDNSRPMYHFPIDDAYLKRNGAIAYSAGTEQLFSPPVAPPVFPVTEATERFNDLFAARRFTSACSSIVARTQDFSMLDSPHDVAFICEPVHNLVHRAVLEPHGASYVAVRGSSEQQSEFLASSDPWFRPVRALVGPDGALYVVDMYRETIEHPEWIPESWQAQLDLTAGSDRGRIYRVTPSDRSHRSLPAVSTWTAPELIEALAADVGPLRDLVQQQVIELNDSSMRPELERLALDDSSAVGRVHALSILNTLEQLESRVLRDAFTSKHAGVLLVAIRLSESRLDEPSFLECLSATARHNDPRVVKQTALALGQSIAPEAGKILAAIACQPTLDEWVARAVLSSSSPHAKLVLRAMLELASKQSEPQTLGRDRLLSKLLATAQATDVDLTEDFAALILQTSIDESTQLRLAASFASALRGTPKGPSATELLRPIYGQALERIADDKETETHRCEALQLVGIGIDSVESERQLLVDLLAPSTPARVQAEAVACLGRLRDVESCQAMIERWPSLSEGIRAHCVREMLQQHSWTQVLLDALESKQIQPRELAPAALQQLKHTGSRSMRVRAERLSSNSTDQEKRTLIRRYLDTMNDETDIVKGAQLFKKHCAVCHVADAKGQAIGASLDNLSDRSEVALTTAILDPNKAVDPKYLTYVIRSNDDRILSGTIEQEAGQSLTIAHADGKRTTIRRSEIADMKNAGISLMPEGMESVLTPDAMRDLIGYLQHSYQDARTP
ncbi:MAG: neutral/alkaline non-lysosomal ceramidase N-terminal domain-containing protein [Rubripirellula sp.]